MSLPPFDRVVTLHGPAVYRVCCAVVGPQLAEDAWSETFLAALRAYPELPAEANVEAWLVTIAHRKALDQGRAEHRRPVPVADVPETARSDSGDLPDTADAAWAALQQLPLKQRQTVAYHHVVGLPYAEIAELLGGTADAARRAAADGIAALRRATRTSPSRPFAEEPR